MHRFKRAQEPPKRPQEPPKMCPRGPKTPQEYPRGSKRHPRAPQEAPRMHFESPKWHLAASRQQLQNNNCTTLRALATPSTATYEVAKIAEFAEDITLRTRGAAQKGRAGGGVPPWGRQSAATRRVGACLNRKSKLSFEFFELKESSPGPRIPPGR